MKESQEIRLVLVSAAPEKALRILDVPTLNVCGVAANIAQLMLSLPALQPHAVLFFDKTPDLPFVLQQPCYWFLPVWNIFII